MVIFLALIGEEVTTWEETGRWIHEAFRRLGHEVIVYDDVWRAALKGVPYANDMLLKYVEKHNPDMVFLLKAQDISAPTLKKIRCRKVLWHPDVRKKVQDWIVDHAKECDLFYTMSLGSIPEYKEHLDNVQYLPEACDPNYHFYAPEVDAYYKSDVNFIGNLRPDSSRIEMAKRIIRDGFNFKLWGGLDEGAIRKNGMDWEILEPYWMRRFLWREYHSYAASDTISVTWDWCPEVELSYSARIYRVMASRGLYLAKYVKGMEKVFQRGVHCDWYETLDEMSEKIQYYLKHRVERKRIGLEAQKECYAKHTFDHRVKKILNDVEKL